VLANHRPRERTGVPTQRSQYGFDARLGQLLGRLQDRRESDCYAAINPKSRMSLMGPEALTRWVTLLGSLG